MARLKGEALPTSPANAEFIERDTTRQRWLDVERVVLAYAAELRREQLDEIITYDMPHRGGMKHNPRWQILLHMVNHGTDHRAQVLPILHSMGAPTFEQDFMIYLWNMDH